MNLAAWPHSLAYLAVFLGTAVEGEVVFASAAVLASMGRLSPPLVFAAAALGGSAGDQFYFYAFRTGLRSWVLSRFPRLAGQRSKMMALVGSYSTAIILACRFLPGLRIAIPVACAYAGVSAIRFSACSLVGSVLWAATVVLLITKAGESSPAWLGRGWGPVSAAILILALFFWLGRRSRRVLEEPLKPGSSIE